MHLTVNRTRQHQIIRTTMAFTCRGSALTSLNNAAVADQHPAILNDLIGQNHFTFEDFILHCGISSFWLPASFCNAGSYAI
jgi:hypothetical protein